MSESPPVSAVLKTVLTGAGLVLFLAGFLLMATCTGIGISFLFFAVAIYLVGVGLALPPGPWQLGLGAAIFGTTILVIGYLIGFATTGCFL